MRFVIHFLTCKCDWKPWLEDRPFLFWGKLAYVSWTFAVSFREGIQMMDILGDVVVWVLILREKDPWTFVHISINTQKLPYLKGVTDLWNHDWRSFWWWFLGWSFMTWLASGPRFSNFSFLSPFWVDFDPKEVGKPHQSGYQTMPR